jgi:hypothetical protein
MENGFKDIGAVPLLKMEWEDDNSFLLENTL